MKNKYKYAIDMIRDHLKGGATIRATDPDGRILDFSNPEDLYGGLTIDYSSAPKKEKKKL